MSPTSLRILHVGIGLLSTVACLLFAAVASVMTLLLKGSNDPQYLVLGSVFLLALVGMAFVFLRIGWRSRVVLAVSLIVAAYLLAPRSMCAAESNTEMGCQ